MPSRAPCLIVRSLIIKIQYRFALRPSLHSTIYPRQSVYSPKTVAEKYDTIETTHFLFAAVNIMCWI